MGAVLLLLPLLLVLGVVAAVVVAVLIAVRNKSNFARDSRLAPGLSTSAPAAWAGSHDPEARLHRRLRDALAALRVNQSFDMDGHLLDLRVELEQQSAALDEQLVATAALPLHLRAEPLGSITAAVESVEQAVADLAQGSTGEAADRLDVALADIRARTGLVAQARHALDAMDDQAALPGTPMARPGAVPSPGRPADPTMPTGPATDPPAAPAEPLPTEPPRTEPPRAEPPAATGEGPSAG